ncbi:DUF3667 domain-containing protein [Winogradskyella sp. UBA3174]|uniref:DUF3667 domain-containing protein n=1 Tax=Winogradskyella sp. UBA3174 TaxID=1947785 RepID=UPI0025DC2609|nr:DUF3667 domain-containing protein [Winogradskyella sp. UBA3174]
MNCKNCHKALNEAQKFCDECGAKIIQNRLKPKVLVEQVNEEFLSIDNRLLKTLIHLLTKPDMVINGFISGTRKKYIGVIQYFAIGLTLLGIQFFFMTNVFNDPELYKMVLLEEIAKMPGQENNPFFNESLNNIDNFNSSQSLFYTLSIPFSAFSTWITYLLLGIRRFNFTEHIVINLYYGAQVVIISAVINILFLGLGFNYFSISYFVTFFTFIYFFYVLKRVFETSFWTTVGHYLLMLIVLGLMIIIATLLFSIIVLIVMYINTEQFTTAV